MMKIERKETKERRSPQHLECMENDEGKSTERPRHKYTETDQDS